MEITSTQAVIAPVIFPHVLNQALISLLLTLGSCKDIPVDNRNASSYGLLSLSNTSYCWNCYW